MTLKANNGEGGTAGQAVAINGPGGSAWQNVYGTAPTYDSTAIAGAISLLFAAASGATSMVEWTGLNGAAVTYGATIRGGSPSQTTVILQTRTAGGKSVAVQYANTGYLQIVNTADTVIYTSTAQLASGTDYDVAVRPNPTTGAVDFAVYAKGSTAALDSTTLSGAVIGSGNLTTVRFGKVSASTWASTLRMDNFLADDAAPWPLPKYAVSPPGLVVSATPQETGLIIGVGSAAIGGALSYAIAQTSGPTTTPTLVGNSTNVWSVTRSTSSDLVYNVTVTEAGGSTKTTSVTMAKFVSALMASQILIPSGAAGSSQWNRDGVIIGGAAVIPPMLPPLLLNSTGDFTINGVKVGISGFNLYDAIFSDNLAAGNGMPSLAAVTEMLDAGVAQGHNAVRIHTLFINHGVTGSIMPTLGNYNEAMLAHADKVLMACRARGLYVMAPLTDRWDYYHGGAWSFVKMSLGDTTLTQAQALAHFYGTSGDATKIAKVRTDFESFWSTLMNRTSTATGTKWKDDTVLAIYETANEMWDITAAKSAQISAFLKGIAPTRLTADGSAASGQTVNTKFKYSTNSLTDANMNIVGAHYYNDYGSAAGTDDHRMDIPQLIQQAAWAREAGKAFVAGEYDWRGAADQGQALRTSATPEQWYAALEQYASGDFMWCYTGTATAQHNDGYQLQIVAPQNATQIAGKAAQKNHALAMKAKLVAPGVSGNIGSFDIGTYNIKD